MACSLLLLLSGIAQAQQPAAPIIGAPSAPAAYPSPLGAPQPVGQPTSMQQPDRKLPPPDAPLAPGGIRAPEQGLDLDQPAPYTIQLEPPGLNRIAEAVQSDSHLMERIRQENRERRVPERIIFPSDPVLSTETYSGRKWDPMKMEVAPYYVCHGRLYFQQINFERYGWELGIAQPLICASRFLYDVALFPYHLAVEPLRRFEYNEGWCLPGDPVPLLLYPLHPSPTGFVAEACTVLALVACFP